MLTWPAYKACEGHVVLIALTAMAGLALVDPELWLASWRWGVRGWRCWRPCWRSRGSPRPSPEARSRPSSPAGSAWEIDRHARAGENHKLIYQRLTTFEISHNEKPTCGPRVLAGSGGGRPGRWMLVG